MTLSQAAVTSFQELYHKKCGIQLDYEAAQVKALEELKRFALIYKPIPKSDQSLKAKLSNTSEKA